MYAIGLMPIFIAFNNVTCLLTYMVVMYKLLQKLIIFDAIMDSNIISIALYKSSSCSFIARHSSGDHVLKLLNRQQSLEATFEKRDVYKIKALINIRHSNMDMYAPVGLPFRPVRNVNAQTHKH
uniref:Uncharacterized protein n=1 Tax=Glossina austeni TaxID=7395 RepID=A0A1A9VV07_GLOAU